MPATIGAKSREQFPLLPPAPLNMTRSATPGTDAPPAPPEVVDQFSVLFQFPGTVPTQYRWAITPHVRNRRKKVNITLMNL